MTLWSRAGITMAWRTVDGTACLYLGGIYIGYVQSYPGTSIWLADLSSNPLADERDPIGFPTEQAARDALVDAAVKALLGEEG